MLMSISLEQAQQAIPDANSQKAAKKLSKQEDWHNKGASSGQWIWGEITGSAIYQSAVYLPELKFECSCPSFKRPCKHALGLLLCYAEHQDLFTVIEDAQTFPERIKKWIEKSQKAAKKADPNEPPKEVDLEARAKRHAARDKKVDDGMAALQQWLQDTLSLGLAKLRADASSINQMIHRLADAQATGINGWLDQLYSSLYQHDWQQQSLTWIARLHLITQLWQRREQLDADLQAEIRQLIGFSIPPDEFAKLPIQTATQWVVGKKIANLSQGNGRYRRQWLWNNATQQASLVLDFEIGSFTTFPPALALNSCVDLPLQYFPSSTPVRAKITENTVALTLKPTVAKHAPNAAWANFQEALTNQQKLLQKNPFLLSYLWVVANLQLVRQDDQTLWIIDQHKNTLPLIVDKPLQFAIAVGDEPFCLAAEWNGQQLEALSLWQAGEFICLN